MKALLRTLLPLLVVGIGGAAAVVLVLAQTPPERKPRVEALRTVDVASLERTSYQHRVVVHGTVVPRTETLLASEVTGRIVSVHPAFEAGGVFRADDALVTVDPVAYEAAVAGAEASVARAEAALARERAEAASAADDWQRFGEGEPSPLALRAPQLAEAEAAVRSARAALQKARIDLERTEVRAPYDGRIRVRLVEIGQFVPAGTPIAKVYAIDAVEVRLPIPSRDLAVLDLPLVGGRVADSPGPQVTLRGEVGGRTFEWPGRVVRTEGIVDPRSRVIHAVARVDDPYSRREAPHSAPLLVGQFVEATVEGRRDDDVFAIPRAALRDGDRLALVGPEGVLRLCPCEVVRRTPDRAVVRCTLRDGERLCTSYLDVLVDGMRVRSRDDESPPTAPETPSQGAPGERD